MQSPNIEGPCLGKLEEKTQISRASQDADSRSKLREMEEKYAQLDNEKHLLIYRVELLKDQLEEQEETLIELQRQYKDKSQDLKKQKSSYSELNTEFSNVKEQLELRDRLVKESGFTFITSEEGKLSLEKCSILKGTIASTTGSLLISNSTADILDKIEGSLDGNLQQLAEENSSLKKESQLWRVIT